MSFLIKEKAASKTYPQRLQIARTVMLQTGSESVFRKAVVLKLYDLNFK